MSLISNCEPKQVFEYFERICSIPHGSGNMEKISEFCLEFAKANNLKAVRDEANNVVIFKDGTKGFENEKPIILQGHLDMVCQKVDGCGINFDTDGITPVRDGDFISAEGTSLGADNGIAVAMIMAILASDKIAHPPIEAVFTTDEEIGMIGAGKLDVSVLKGKAMINLDSEEQEVLTVSCAGGVDCKISVPVDRVTTQGESLTLTVKNLSGGHSGVEIDKGRVNANILMSRVLSHVKNKVDFDIVSVGGGDKKNAIPVKCEAQVVAEDVQVLKKALSEYFDIIKKEISEREKNVSFEICENQRGQFEVLDKKSADRVLYMLLTTPNGVIDMSCEIPGLVETSLNLGVLKTQENAVVMEYALRSNKKSALDFLSEMLCVFAGHNLCDAEFSGRYEPWEYNEKSSLREIYSKAFEEKFGHKPKVEAIHAGLECAVFSASIENLDCIAIGPDMFGVHTTEEKLSISSTKAMYELLCEVIGKIR